LANLPDPFQIHISHLILQTPPLHGAALSTQKVMMQEVISYIAQSLVEHPQEVQVDTHRVGSTIYIDVTAAPGDVGRLIGRRGRTAQAIRQVAKAAAVRQGLRVVVDID